MGGGGGEGGSNPFKKYIKYVSLSLRSDIIGDMKKSLAQGVKKEKTTTVKLWKKFVKTITYKLVDKKQLFFYNNTREGKPQNSKLSLPKEKIKRDVRMLKKILTPSP